MALEVRAEAQDKASIIHLKGEMDSAAVGAYENEVKSAMESGRYNLVLDMAELIYLDSSGLSSIIRTLRITSKYGGSLKIAGVNQAIKKIFDITRLGEIIDTHPNLESALGSFGNM